jgi:hypothetical protein
MLLPYSQYVQYVVLKNCPELVQIVFRLHTMHQNWEFSNNAYLKYWVMYE